MRSTSEPPATDDLTVTERLGVKGYVDDVPLAQFVKWGLDSELIPELISAGTASSRELAERTWLTPSGADALLGVLVAAGLVDREDGHYRSTGSLEEFLGDRSPFFLGESLTFSALPIPLPEPFVNDDHPSLNGWRGRGRQRWQRASWRLIRLISRTATESSPGWILGEPDRLLNQHRRNLPACVVAANLPIFDDVACVIDVGGGTGTLAVPLKTLHRATRVVITDLPQALDGIRRSLDEQGAADIEVVALDALSDPWNLPPCDLIFFGNLLHIFDDKTALGILQRAAAHLRTSGGGTVVLHELVWNPDRTGPLKTALFDFTMRGYGDGKQRTVTEFEAMLDASSFEQPFATPTSSGFVAIGGRISA